MKWTRLWNRKKYEKTRNSWNKGNKCPYKAPQKVMNLFNTFLLPWKHLVKTDCRCSPEHRDRKEEYTSTVWLEWGSTLFLPEKNVKIISQLWLNNNSDLIHWPQAHTPKRKQLQTQNGNMNIRIFLSNLYWKASGQVFFRIQNYSEFTK